MIGSPNILGIGDTIYKYSQEGRIDCDNGSAFICPISGGSLRFLHKIFEISHGTQRELLEDLYGFSLPDDYLSFMHSCNGATLFDNSFYLYGICRNFNRGLALEDQQPISLETELRNSELCHDPDYPWRSFGSVVGYEKVCDLEVDASGRVRMRCGDGPARYSSSVRDLVRNLASFLDRFTDQDGFIPESKRRIDADLDRFIETQ